ncbi:MAG: MG2 domain-containing protein [Caldilineaceae bacterium]
MLPCIRRIAFTYYQVWLLALCLLPVLAGCQTQLAEERLRIGVLEAPSLLAPDQSYTFRFAVNDRATEQPLPAAPVEALLTFDNGVVERLFDGQTDAGGQLTFTYQTPYRQPAGLARLTIQAQSATGVGQWQTDLELLPSLLILPRQLPDQVAPGSQATIVLQIYDPIQRERVAGVPVQARLTFADDEVLDLFQGESKATGEVEFMLNLPTDLHLRPVRLDVYAQAAAGEAHFQRKVTVVAPVTIAPLTAPKSVFTGSQVTYSVRIDDNVNHEPAAYSDVQVYLSGGDYNWGTPIVDDQANASGVVSFTFTAPNTTYPTSLYLDLRAQGFEGNASYTKQIEVIPALSLSLLGLSERVTAGSSSPIQVRVWDNQGAVPAHDAAVTVEIGDNNGAFQKRLQGTTDAAGMFIFRLELPANLPDSWLNLTVNATTAEATGAASYGIAVQTGYQLLITTDKPIYQPGQTMHIRLLALDSASNQPAAAAPAQLIIYDARGNTLIERKLTTSAYGIATADLDLDSQAGSGVYQISIGMGSSYNSQRVEVKPYTLPRFQITITDTHPYYTPGATAEGTVEATYFFGKPVAAGQVVIRGYGPTALNAKDEDLLFEVRGRTDATGRYVYQLPLPATFRDQLRNKTSKIRLEVDVIDGADHLEQSDATLILAEQPFLLTAVPEAGRLKPGLANLVYLQVSHPDGSAAQTALDITVGDATAWRTVTTDAFGLATLVVTPTQQADLPLLVYYSDNTTSYTATIELPVNKGKTPAILLRPTAAEFPVGGALTLDLWVARDQMLPAETHAYVEIVKAGQVLQTAAVPMQAGYGHVALPLDPHLVGAVLVNAHLLLAGNQRSSDARLVLVNPTPVDVAVTADAAVYRPGDTAHLTITATHQAEAQQGVVGVTIVDESVFALDERDAGFARTFFLLDRELRKARYGISGFAPFGDAQSPYDTYASYRAARYPAIEPTLFEKEAKGAAIFKQARTTALLAWMAQDLQATDTATPPEMTVAQHATTRPPNHSGAVVLLLALGVVAYTGRHKVTPPLVALFLVGLSSFLWVACAPAAPAAAPAESALPAPQGNATPEHTNAPRLRRFFPETLLWLPEQETDAQGRTTIAVPLADSITTWRVSVLFSDGAGNLGSAETDLRVFQDFFVEPQVPSQLTLGDEVQAPVNLYNYLEHPQTITLTVMPIANFSYTKYMSTTITQAANEVAVAYFPLRVTKVGETLFAVSAIGDQMSDQVQRHVQVIYNGEAQTRIASGRLTGSLTLPMTLPVEAITETRQVTLRLYPNTLSQVRQGLAGLLQRPSGNAADLANQNFANGLLLSLLQQEDVPATDSLRRQAERLIGQGYQRQLAYESEREPGGFSFYGDPPARPWLSAYILWQLMEMSQHTYVDPQLTIRITTYLAQQQLPDGSWPADEMRYYGPWRARQARLATTAYIAWMMAESGNPNSAALAYLSQAQSDEMADPYVQALVSNALLTSEETSAQAFVLLHQLTAQQQSTQGLTYWPTALTTFLGSWGESADQETTALIAYALLRSGGQLDLAQSALDYLLNQRTADGAFATPQLTVLTLKALLLAAAQEEPQQTATVTVALDGQMVQQLTLDATVAQRQEITLTALPPTATLQVTVNGSIVAPYQLISAYVLPWEQVAAHNADAPAQPFLITTDYEQNTAVLHGVVTMQTTITMSTEAHNDRRPGLMVATLGLPPGFTLLPADLAALARMRVVSAYEVRQNQLLLYLNRLYPGRNYTFAVRMKVNTPGTFQALSAQLTELYNSNRRSVAPPRRLQITAP